MARTLITPGEILTASPESSRYPAAALAPHIRRCEETLANNCLGRAFYQSLLTAAIDYGTVATWKAGETYALNQYVDYYGLILKSKIAGNAVNPCDDDGTRWESARKFGTDDQCLEDLWTMYLRDHLSFVVVAASLDYTTFPAGAKGVTEWQDVEGGSRSAGMTVLQARKRKLLEDAAQTLDNMKIWMIEQHKAEECDFSLVPFVKSSCSTGCETNHQRRRFAFHPTNKRYFT